jgi:hypothetical protein
MIDEVTQHLIEVTFPNKKNYGVQPTYCTTEARRHETLGENSVKNKPYQREDGSIYNGALMARRKEIITGASLQN